MAEKDNKSGGEAAAAGSKKGKGKLLIIIAVALTLLGGGGGAAAYFMLGKNKHEVAQYDEEDDAPEGQTAKEKPDAKHDKTSAKKGKKRRKNGPPVFVELDMFTANLKDDDGRSEERRVG